MTQEKLSSIISYDDDLTNAERPAPLPTGVYVGEIVSTEQKQGAKTTYVDVGFSISADQYPVDYTEGNPDGTIIHYLRVPTGKTPQQKYRMRKFIEAIGAPLGATVDIAEWAGLTAKVTVVHEEWEGEMNAKISKVESNN